MCDFDLWNPLIFVKVSYVHYQYHTVYIYGFIDVICARIFHSVDAVWKENYVKAWTDDKKKMQSKCIDN